MQQIIAVLLAIILILSSAAPHGAPSMANTFPAFHSANLLGKIVPDIVGTWTVTEFTLIQSDKLGSTGGFDPRGSSFRVTEDGQFWLNDDKLQVMTLEQLSCQEHSEEWNFDLPYLEERTGNKDRTVIHLRGEENDVLSLSLIISSEGLFLSTSGYFERCGLYRLEDIDLDFLDPLGVTGTWTITQLALGRRYQVDSRGFDPVGSTIKITEDHQFWLNDERLLITRIERLSCAEDPQIGSFVYTQFKKVVGNETYIDMSFFGEKNKKVEAGIIISSEGLFFVTGEYFASCGLYAMEKVSS